MAEKIRVAILDDHQSIIDGYLYRLNSASDIEVVATLSAGEELEPALLKTQTDILLLDISVPISSIDPSPYPILYTLPRLLQLYPTLEVLVISMHAQPTLINAIMEAGASGYLLKDDLSAIRDLAAIVRSIVAGGIFMSDKAYDLLMRRPTSTLDQPLTARQIQAISLCAAYPEANSDELAKKMEIANSTFRNLISGAYLRLNVRNRSAAISKARRLGLITPTNIEPDIHSINR
jgi:two-component system, NarL family, nitrate/nitrite response regulator NarL